MAKCLVFCRPFPLWRNRSGTQGVGTDVPLHEIVTRHVTCYNSTMIRSLADRRTETLFSTGQAGKLPPDIVRRALRKLDMVDNAYRIDDLRMPPGNRLHALSGDRDGQWAISVNDQWRICFRFEGEDAFDVELCDYH